MERPGADEGQRIRRTDDLDNPVTSRLQCVECGRVAREGERGWTARLTYDDEVVVYCPECDDREFGNVEMRPVSSSP